MESPFRADCANGLVVFVTGGGSGIGHGICEVFAAHGAKIGIFGRRKAVLDAACTSLRERWPGCEALAVAGDVRSPDACAGAVATVVETFGRLDVLVNAAAGNFMALAEDLGGRGFKTVIEIDLQGTFNMSVAALPALSLINSPRTMPKLAGGPVIINISATLQYKALPFQSHASAAKAAIDSLTKTLGVEWAADHQVRVTGIAPGPIAGTEGGPTGRVFGAAIAGQDVADIVPLARWGETHDIGLTALYLSSTAGSYVSSETLAVDGGHWHDAARQFRAGRELVRGISASRKAPASKL